jgi:hypothetical protein
VLIFGAWSENNKVIASCQVQFFCLAAAAFAEENNEKS